MSIAERGGTARSRRARSPYHQKFKGAAEENYEETVEEKNNWLIPHSEKLEAACAGDRLSGTQMDTFKLFEMHMRHNGNSGVHLKTKRCRISSAQK